MKLPRHLTSLFRPKLDRNVSAVQTRLEDEDFQRDVFRKAKRHVPWYSVHRRGVRVFIVLTGVYIFYSHWLSNFWSGVVRGYRLEQERKQFIAEMDAQEKRMRNMAT